MSRTAALDIVPDKSDMYCHFFLMIFCKSYTILYNYLKYSPLGLVYLFIKVTLPTLLPKQVVLVSLRRSFRFV